MHMTKEFRYLMYLFSCGAKGIKAKNPDRDVSWDTVLMLAKEQSIYHTVLYAIKLMEDCSLPESEKAPLLTTLKNDAIRFYIQQAQLMELLSGIESQGVPVILLKGYDVARYYAFPYGRISGDDDIYVEPQYERKVQYILKQHGYKVRPRDKRSHHAICEHPFRAPLELHVVLYDKIIEDVWFGGANRIGFVQEPVEINTTEQGSYCALGKTDNSVFLFLHMIKHFIEGGMSLRLIMDFVLYLSRNKALIDWSRVRHVMEILKYDYFMDAILNIAVRYFSFDAGDFFGIKIIQEEGIETLINDMEVGGWLGANSKAMREQGWHEYNRLRYLENRGGNGYKRYMLSWNAKGYIKQLFPSKRNLYVSFPYAKKSILLLPVAWLHRLVVKGIPHVLKGRLLSYTVDGETDLNDIAKERVKLFRQLKII